jgi:large conductance mechanosensitive channel
VYTPAAWVVDAGPSLNVTLCCARPLHVNVTTEPIGTVVADGENELSATSMLVLVLPPPPPPPAPGPVDEPLLPPPHAAPSTASAVAASLVSRTIVPSSGMRSDASGHGAWRIDVVPFTGEDTAASAVIPPCGRLLAYLPHANNFAARGSLYRAPVFEGGICAMWQEFKAFVMRGNVMDLAVGVIIGASFGAVIKSLVDDVIMPPIGVATGGVDFSEKYTLLKAGIKAPPPYASLTAAKDAGAVTLNYGAFINTLITFLIVALAVFMLVRAINRMYRKPAEATPDTRPCPYCTMTIPLKATRCPNCTSQLTASPLAA